MAIPTGRCEHGGRGGSELTISTAAVLAVIVSTTLAVILVLLLVCVPIAIWIFRALTGKLGR